MVLWRGLSEFADLPEGPRGFTPWPFFFVGRRRKLRPSSATVQANLHVIDRCIDKRAANGNYGRKQRQSC